MNGPSNDESQEPKQCSAYEIRGLTDELLVCLSTDPKDIAALASIGDRAIAIGDTDNAARALHQLATVYLEQHSSWQAHSVMRHLLSMSLAQPWVVEHIRELDRKNETADALRRLHHRINDLVRRNHAVGVLDVCYEILQTHPNDEYSLNYISRRAALPEQVVALRTLLRVYRDRGDRKQQESVIERLVAAGVTDDDVLKEMKRIQEERARAEEEQFRTSAFHRRRTLLRRSRAALAAGSLIEAVRDCEALRSEFDDVETLRVAGDIEFALGRSPESVALYERALLRTNDRGPLWSDETTTSALYEAIIRANPRRLDAYIRYGVARVAEYEDLSKRACGQANTAFGAIFNREEIADFFAVHSVAALAAAYYESARFLMQFYIERGTGASFRKRLGISGTELDEKGEYRAEERRLTRLQERRDEALSAVSSVLFAELTALCRWCGDQSTAKTLARLRA